MEFPRLMYASPGKAKCQGGTFDTIGVDNQEEFDKFKEKGWHASLPEALRFVEMKRKEEELKAGYEVDAVKEFSVVEPRFLSRKAKK